jgi:DNA-binding MarR family transcriptional regulator
MNRLFELGTRLTHATEQGLETLGLTLARATLLWQVHHRGPLTQRELSQLLGVTPRNVTGLVDALEAGGFVVRAPHPTDRRATLVTLTEAGQATATLRDDDYQDFALRLFGGIPAGRLATFIEVADQVLDRLRQEPSR